MSLAIRSITIAVAILLFAGCGGNDAEFEALQEQIADLQEQLIQATSTTSSSIPTTTSQTMAVITGSLTVEKSRMITVGRPVGSPCTVSGGYDDIRQGADVVVRDSQGKTVGADSLEAGEVVEIEPDSTHGYCRFVFSVFVPDNLDFYEIEVSHRGGLTYSRAELVADGWTVSFSLG